MANCRAVTLVRFCALLVLTVALSAAVGCKRAPTSRFQGYAEGEFVYVASPQGGALVSLFVKRGDHVQAGGVLFELDSEPQKAARDEAEKRLAQARATLEDLKKGLRPAELAAIQAQIEQAKASLAFSEAEIRRQQKLIGDGGTTQENLDRALALRDADAQRVAQLEATLETGRLGARPDQIAAAQESVSAMEAALKSAEWALAQTRQAAPQAGRIFDTLYREGEFVAAGRPVVVVLPPQNIKARAFLPQGRASSVRQGEAVRVFVDGVKEPFAGKVSFISPTMEYTPPVIYSRESREKLVVMVEAAFEPDTAAMLHPGQPLDMEFGN